MRSKIEILEWIIENCTNFFGEIDLSKLNFGKRKVLLNGIKTKGNIDNYNQEAYYIDNYGQKAEHRIKNSFQESKQEIINIKQKANVICNIRQEANSYIDNSLQKSQEINNRHQKATIEYWNKTKK